MSIDIYDDNVKDHPYILASNEPCYEVNPVLWRLFCVFTGRDFMNASTLWSEQHVINSLVSRGVEYRDDKSASHRS